MPPPAQASQRWRYQDVRSEANRAVMPARLEPVPSQAQQGLVLVLQLPELVQEPQQPVLVQALA